MAEFTPEQAEAAKIALSGGFGSLVFVHLRNPGSIFRGCCAVGVGVGIASIFTPMVAGILGMQVIPVAALLALCGIPLSGSVLKAAERFDLSAWLRKERP